ncbi:Putative NADH-flavin reductase [Variovorax sp. PBS-H4]|uniref:SDR family oxidoreductase n=1 Tax=Variovorax sp. PBS-H4 TaxID=434008 RepID=UPI00131739C8|nr:SDR family oxidoreductase [Variovorax sp. PBS-H4]VTU34829.1 Putative NADH-flavin reductase [Variovorax sp. PBS-H4]
MSSSKQPVALVAGASGIVGTGIAQRLVADGWRVLCASRSGGGCVPGTEGIAVDLMDPQACRQALLPYEDISHVFYAAYQQAQSRAAEVAPNLGMLRNVVEAASAAAPGLRKIVLVTGAKFYGIQWGAVSTPCRESDARQLPPNFYYDQQDFLCQAQRGQAWSWVNLIPPFVSGFAVGNPMNLVLGIGIYAAVCKELGLPLRFPGSTGAYDALHQIADAQQIGAAASWAASAEAAANQAFNVANGDAARWRNTWPVIAASLGMEAAQPKTMPLADVMPDQQAVWNRVAQRQGLRGIDIAKIVDWAWVDYMLRMSHDVVLETGKIRRAGFHACIETDRVFVQRLRELQEHKVIPR